MKKYKILVFLDDVKGGVGYYRSITPHLYFQHMYKDEFEISYYKDFPIFDIENTIKEFDLIHFHRILDAENNVIKIANKLKIPIICDIDDYWKLSKEHPNYNNWSKYKLHIPIIEALKLSTHITTTTSIFADEIRKINPNVTVIPNAIDMSNPQYHLSKTKSNRIKFGIICGSSHLHDIKILRNNISKLDKNILDKIQLNLCGFDTSGTKLKTLPNGTNIEVPLDPKEHVYFKYEQILTNNYKLISKEHKDFLMEFTPQAIDPFEDEPYRRHWTKPIDSYYQHYNYCDVLLAPLVENDFNLMKSQLKLIEAGMNKIPIICQNYGAYTIDTIPFLEKEGKINLNGNALLVDTNKNHKQWGKYITYLTENPDFIKLIGDNLFKTIFPKYELSNTTQLRYDLYKKILLSKLENNKN